MQQHASAPGRAGRCRRIRRSCWDPQALAAINTVSDALPPRAVGQIPFHGLAQTGFEGFLRLPAKFGGNSCGVDCVSQIMPGTIGNECDEGLTTSYGLAGSEFIQQCANRLNDGQVGPLAATTNAIGLARSPPADDGQQCPRM